METRPYPNEHSARIIDPDKFQKNSFRRKNIERGIDIIIGKLIGEDSMTTQAYRFKANIFTVAEAKAWLKKNKIKYISFEPASGEKTMEKAIYTFGQIREIPKDVEETRTISFVVSDESKDRHNSIIKSEGWDLTNYEKNPIVGYQHQLYSGWTAPDPDNVLGIATVKKENKQLLADITFEPEDINPLAEKIFRKILHGSIRATSVGFYPKKQHDGDPEKDEKEEKGVVYYDAAELLEISVVNLPSNPNAIKNAAKEDKVELLTYILNEALGDKFNESLTIKGVLNILRGEDPDQIVKFPNRLKVLNKLIKIKEDGKFIA
jgi:HK97 family phage prohead protease